MKSGVSANQLWTQVPVANRLIEVNTKTGFSLTAGSYSVRASSNQTGTASFALSATSGTAAISAVTLVRACILPTGFSNDASPGVAYDSTRMGRFTFNSTTQIVWTRNVGTYIPNTVIGYFQVQELF